MIMDLLIFFAIVLSTIILAIVLQRIIHCPMLVGFAFFAIYLIVSAVLENVTLVIIAIILGIIAFFSALIDSVITRSEFFRNNNSTNGNDNQCCCNCNNNNDDDNDTLTIINSNGEVVARISGNSVSCSNNNSGDGCENSNNLLSDTIATNIASSCGCVNRNFRRR
jgi:hypothetical protein